jgi:hypothetical protein
MSNKRKAGNGHGPKVLKTPKAIGALIDRVGDMDRAYFEEHPGETEYHRPYVPGEMWPAVDDTAVFGVDHGEEQAAIAAGATIEWGVRVIQIKPGVRVRAPYKMAFWGVGEGL